MKTTQQDKQQKQHKDILHELDLEFVDKPKNKRCGVKYEIHLTITREFLTKDRKCHCIRPCDKLININHVLLEEMFRDLINQHKNLTVVIGEETYRFIKDKATRAYNELNWNDFVLESEHTPKVYNDMRDKAIGLSWILGFFTWLKSKKILKSYNIKIKKREKKRK